jgi:hypothetical protein
MIEIEPGLCLHLRAASNPVPHLYVVLTEPSGEPPEVAIVNFSSYRDGLDDTVILEPGDHSFIKRTSFVNYAEATKVTVAKLQTIVEMDITVPHRERCSPELLRRIRDGVQASDFTSLKFQRYCEGKF